MNQVLKEGVLYCQLESFNAEAEYSDGNCIRLIGISSQEFESRQFEDGVTTYTIEIKAPIFFRERFIWMPFFSLAHLNSADCTEYCPAFNEWFKVCFFLDQSGESFIYLSFGGDDPARVSVKSMSPIDGPLLPTFPSLSLSDIDSPSEWQFSSFEVGQGMASIIYDEDDAFLFDAGAGTPIKRLAYTKGLLSSYDLRDLVSTRNVVFFLSHGDYDHWCMLGWDSILRKAISTFVVPAGVRRIAFFDTAVKLRVRECAAHIIGHSLGPKTLLNIYRTSPTFPTSNNDGLIAVFEKNGQRALIAGDCVYSELLKDSDPVVRGLAKNSYSAIVVPHHGDSASARSVPASSSVGGSIPTAFFSAGNHGKYGHPTSASLNAHHANGYANRCQKDPKGIAEVILL